MPMYAVKYRYCPECGGPLKNSVIGGQPRETCPKCSFVHWGEYSLGVGGVLWREKKILLVQRAYNPGKGFWTIPGGYVDQHEGIDTAIAREIFEETGVTSEAESIIALRDRPGDKHDAYIVFLMKDLGGELKPDLSEVSDIGFFTLEECKKLKIAPLSLSVVEASLSRNPGFTRKRDVELIGKSSALFQLDI